MRDNQSARMSQLDAGRGVSLFSDPVKAQVARRFVLYLTVVIVAATATLFTSAVVSTSSFLDREWGPDRSIGDFVAEKLNRAPWVERPDRPSVPPAQVLKENLPVWTLAVIAPFAWYLLIWTLFGNKPKVGVVFPRFRPPRGLSPAKVRQIVGMEFDDKVMAAEILNLAVRGHIRIIRTEPALYRLQCIAGGRDLLTPGQRHLLKALFLGGPEIVIGPENAPQLRVAMETFQKKLEEELEGPIYVTHLGVTATGMIISGASLMAALLTYHASSLLVTDLIMAGIAVLLIVFMNAVFVSLMKTPSKLGRELLDEIAGFRMFLTTAEHERMKMADSCEMSEHLYAAYMPYALAMNIELEWAEVFARTAKRAVPNALDFDWYSDLDKFQIEIGLIGMALSLGAVTAEVLCA
jgi:hypothetical protein